MNRSDRRKAQRAAERPRMYTQAEIQAIELAATKRAFVYMLAFPLLALRDTEGFGKKRLSRFMDNLLDKYDDYTSDYFNLEDVHAVIKEETGVVISECE